MSDPSALSRRPTVRLKPNISAQPLRFGAPWVFSDQIVQDRRTRAIAPGTAVVLEDAERQPLGVGAFNHGSKIALRMLDSDPSAVIDGDWIAARLMRALALRERLYDRPFYRLVHAEGDGLPGLVIDRFGPVAVVQPNAAWAEIRIEAVADALVRTNVTAVVKNGLGRARGLEGLDNDVRVLRGEVHDAIAVPVNGATYFADVIAGQKTGLFFDQRPNHALAASLATGADVLDVFSHVGGFALAALCSGAASALAVDGSGPALGLAERGAAATGVAARFAVRKADAFDAMAALASEQRRFGLVVADPPAFAPNKAALEAGLRAYERVARLAAALVEPGGFLVLCSCSHAADLARFREASLHGIGRAGRSSQILHTGFAGPDHPVHPHLAESAYLKALFFRLDG